MLFYFFILRQRKTNQFCDISLEVDDQKFPTHRCVLASASEYFRAMFTADVS